MITMVLLAVTVHEVCHGWAALRLGDDTAYHAGRLTLNPVAHIDMFGSLLLPFLLYVGTHGAFTFAWAKPVPVNPQRFRRDVTMRTGMSLVAAAGPLSNVLLAVLFAVIFRAGHAADSPYSTAIVRLTAEAAAINLYLAFFNFIPIPPLDGSKVMLHFLRPNAAYALLRLEPYGFFIILFLFYATPLGGLVSRLTYAAVALLLGIG